MGHLRLRNRIAGVHPRRNRAIDVDAAACVPIVAARLGDRAAVPAAGRARLFRLGRGFAPARDQRDDPLRYGTILTLLSLAVGIPIVNLHELLAHYQAAVRIPEWVWLLVVAPIALVLLQRLHELGVQLVDRLLNRRFHRARRKLAETGDAILAARRLDVIDRLLVINGVEALALLSGVLFRRRDGTCRRTCAVGWDDSALCELARERDSLVLSSLERRTPVRLPRDDWDVPQLEANLREPSLAVPIQSDVLGDIGIALFGPHESGNDIDEDECDMLVARRAARGRGVRARGIRRAAGGGFRGARAHRDDAAFAGVTAAQEQ